MKYLMLFLLLALPYVKASDQQPLKESQQKHLLLPVLPKTLSNNLSQPTVVEQAVSIVIVGEKKKSKPFGVRENALTRDEEKGAEPNTEAPSKTSSVDGEYSEEQIERKESYNPDSHPVLRNSAFARKYVQYSTVCCFVGERWFKTGAFLAGVGTVALSALSYGITDEDLKNKLILANLIIQIGGTALNKFASYAHTTVDTDERQFRMFKSSTSSNV